MADRLSSVLLLEPSYVEQCAVVQIDSFTSAVEIAAFLVLEADNLDSDVCQAVPEEEVLDVVFLNVLGLG